MTAATTAMPTPRVIRERGIAFHPSLLPPIDDGRKTQTRRLIIPRSAPRVTPLTMAPWIIPLTIDAQTTVNEWQTDDDGLPLWAGAHPDYPTEDGKWFSCPYGGPGWRLWVKESFALVPATAYRGSDVPHQVNPNDPSEWAIYRDGWDRSRPAARWRSPRIMPKWAARRWLLVEDARAEVLQEISTADAYAEGVESISDTIGCFADLWDSINAKRGYGWAVRPWWVWAVSFRRVTP